MGVAQTTSAPEPIEQNQLAGLRVLVVNDNPTNRRILGEMIERWGMKPLLAESGVQALAALQQAKESAAPLTALQLANVGGIPDRTASHWWRESVSVRALRQTTIMMLTSAGQRGDAARCRQLGIAAYLVKRRTRSWSSAACIGWKEFELEVMRDHATTSSSCARSRTSTRWACHTGDSITVAPAMTLSDREYQRHAQLGGRDHPRDRRRRRGCNIQFAINPADGEMIVIEMNPGLAAARRLASKATGFPIARIGANFAVGYTPRRAAKRHHEDDAGVVRAGARLRRRQSAALRVRSSPPATPPHHADEIGRRGHGDRSHVQEFQKGIRALETGRPGWTSSARLKDDRLPDDSIEALRAALPPTHAGTRFPSAARPRTRDVDRRALRAYGHRPLVLHTDARAAGRRDRVRRGAERHVRRPARYEANGVFRPAAREPPR